MFQLPRRNGLALNLDDEDQIDRKADGDKADHHAEPVVVRRSSLPDIAY
jgi:hypothetical protein